MSRNTQRTPQAARKQSRGGTLVGLFIGLVIGLVCAFGVAWYLQKSPLPFLDKGLHPEKSETPRVSEQSTPQTPAPLPGKPGEKPVSAAASSDKPRFEFYKILPGGQEAAPKTAESHVGDTPVVRAEHPNLLMYIENLCECSMQ